MQRKTPAALLPFLGLLLAAPLLAAPSATALDGWLADVDQATSRAEKSGRYILVDLYADWCGWCKVLEEKVFSTSEFRRYAEDFVLLRVDTEDGEEGSALQARYGASTLPTTLVLDAAGVLVGSVSGFLPTPRFIAALEEEIGLYENLLELYPRVLEGDDPELQERLAADLHERRDGRRAAKLYERLLEGRPASGGALADLRFRAADAHRLGGDLAAAERHARQARRLATEHGDDALLEELDLLSYRIAHARGDCEGAMASLERFLAEHPRSLYSSEARRTLRTLKQGEGVECT